MPTPHPAPADTGTPRQAPLPPPSVHRPTPSRLDLGHVYVAAVARPPYERATVPTLVDVQSLDSAALSALLSEPSSANTANTSEVLGAVSMLSAMARAVRSRSYVLIAAVSSDAGALLRCMACNRRSNASVMSFTVMDALTVVEVTGGQHSPQEGRA